MQKQIAKATFLFLFCVCLTTNIIGQGTKLSPNPVLTFQGQEEIVRNGKTFTKFKFAVENRNSYPNELFAESPDLPPCGANKRSARTWVDFFDQRGKRLNGFCAIKNPEGLADIWFIIEAGGIPPSWVYIEMNDRKEQIKFKSNLAETTL